MSTHLGKGTVTFVIIAFLAVGALGLANHGMTTHADGHMSNCPLLGATALCKMSPLEHMAAWRGMFAALPFRDIPVLAFLLLLAVFTVFFFEKLRDIQKPELVPLHKCRFRERSFIVRNPLQEAFSSGILNSKLF